MSSDAQGPGRFTLECDDTGAITNVLHDQGGALTHIAITKSFMGLLHPSSWAKGRAFFNEMAASGAAYDWELRVLLNGSTGIVQFDGLYRDDTYLIMANGQAADVKALLEEIVRITNEQANQLRLLTRERILPAATGMGRHYDEVSRVNNELANLQRELARKNADLERLNTLKNQFLGMAAHDLRSPLDVIMMYSDFIQSEADNALNQEHREFLDIIQQSSQYMLQLVDTFLDLSVIESGRLVMTPRSVNVVMLVRENAALNEVIARRKSITLVVDADVPGIMVSVDPDRLNQALTNLLTNAIKFSEPGTQITVSVSQDGDSARIAVQDEGQGIPPDQIDTLFDFYGKRSHRGTEGEKGSGLGLAITCKIVHESHGTIEVTSQPGIGSTFTIVLPIQHEGQPDQHE